MSTLGRMWRGPWRRFRQDDEAEGAAELRDSWVRPALRLAIIFAMLFGGVFFAFWWAGSAVRFSAARAADRTAPTWRVSGTVRDAVTHQPISWALVEDDPGGAPPFFRADADYSGAFELVTLAEPHRIRVSAPGYHPASVGIGRAWFEWMPRGNEKKNIDLQPFHSLLSPQTWVVPPPARLYKRGMPPKISPENVLHTTLTSARLVMVGLVPAITLTKRR